MPNGADRHAKTARPATTRAGQVRFTFVVETSRGFRTAYTVAAMTSTSAGRSSAMAATCWWMRPMLTTVRRNSAIRSGSKGTANLAAARPRHGCKPATGGMPRTPAIGAGGCCSQSKGWPRVIAGSRYPGRWGSVAADRKAGWPAEPLLRGPRATP